MPSKLRAPRAERRMGVRYELSLHDFPTNRDILGLAYSGFAHLPAVHLLFVVMSVLHPRLFGRWMSTVVTVVLLIAASLTLIHWHQDSSGQRCEICFARNLPSIYVPFTVALDAPIYIEWHILAEE